MFVLQTHSIEEPDYAPMYTLSTRDGKLSVNCEANADELSRKLHVFHMDVDTSIEYLLEWLNTQDRENLVVLSESIDAFYGVLPLQIRQVAPKVVSTQELDKVLQRSSEFEWIWIASPSLLTRDTQRRIQAAGLKTIYTDFSDSSEGRSCDGIFLDAVCCKEESMSFWKTYLGNLKRECAIVTYHQGWTDIINSAAFISYYARMYKKLYLCIREDTVDLHSFLSSQFPNVIFVKGPPSTWYDFLPDAVEKIRNEPRNSKMESQDIHIIGILDELRQDSYRRIFRSLDYQTEFWLKFYSAYDIPYTVSLNFFDIVRNRKAEDELYEKVVKTNLYNVVHLTERSNLQIPNHEELQIKEYECYELNQISPQMFDAIKILQNAKGIYLIDSLWAAICYHLDAKYRLFSHIPVTVYCLRNYKTMFTKPVNLPNWNVKVDLS